MAGVSTRIGAAETKISQNADAITLRATKEELATAKSDAIDSAAADATSKATAAESNAKSYADAQLKVTNEKIETKVSKGDIASTINQTAQSVQIEASKINLKGAVTTEDISADGLNAKVIQAGTITATEIKADTITAGNLAYGQIMVKIWENASPNSEFNAQTIKLDSKAWSQIMFIFVGAKSEIGATTGSEIKMPYVTSIIPCPYTEDSTSNDALYSVSIVGPVSPVGIITYPNTTPFIARRNFTAWNFLGKELWFEFRDASLLLANMSTSSILDISSGKKYGNRLVNEYMIPIAAYGIK